RGKSLTDCSNTSTNSLFARDRLFLLSMSLLLREQLGNSSVQNCENFQTKSQEKQGKLGARKMSFTSLTNRAFANLRDSKNLTDHLALLGHNESGGILR